MNVVLTVACTTALTIAASGAFAQPASGAMSAASSTDATTRYAPGRETADTSKMGIAGPESPVDAKAPNAASCTTIIKPDERAKCLTKARQADRERAAASAASAGRRTTKP